MPDEKTKTMIEKIKHTYTTTGKKLSEDLDLVGIITSVSSEQFTYCDKDDATEKTGFKIVIVTMENKEHSKIKEHI